MMTFKKTIFSITVMCAVIMMIYWLGQLPRSFVPHIPLVFVSSINGVSLLVIGNILTRTVAEEKRNVPYPLLLIGVYDSLLGIGFLLYCCLAFLTDSIYVNLTWCFIITNVSFLIFAPQDEKNQAEAGSE